jgi:L-alanine-DL-glutamate epimerase-like enolase superfamily enzyme
MIEQPLPAGKDEALGEIERPIPVCADESCHDRASLAALKGRYDLINIKLDKTGGLTHGLELAQAARATGLGIMIGCMGGTSLSMAPMHVIAQLADFVDIDGPLLLRNDRPGGFVYDKGMVSLPGRRFWGTP